MSSESDSDEEEVDVRNWRVEKKECKINGI